VAVTRALVLGLLSCLVAGCGDQTGVRQAAFEDRLEAASAAAADWRPDAELVAVFGVERGANVPVPEWLAPMPAPVANAVDPVVGDGLAPWWIYTFQSGRSWRAFAVGASGAVLGPIDLGDVEDASPSVDDVLDPSDVHPLLQDAGAWVDDHDLVSWDLFRRNGATPAIWVVREDGAGSSVIVVDAVSGAILCQGEGDGGVTFGSPGFSTSGQVNAVTPWSETFEVEAGHDGLGIQLSGSDELLNELDLALTSPSGQGTSLHWISGTPPASAYIQAPEAGTWTLTVSQSRGVAANAVVSIAPDGVVVTCDA
jgi:hypothetical protein